MASRPQIANDLGDLLLREGLLSEKQLKDAVARQRSTQRPLMRILVEERYIDEVKRLNFLKRQYGVPVLALEADRIEPMLFGLIPASIARRHHLVPVKRDKDGLIVAMEDPSDLVLIDDLKNVTGLRIRPVASHTEEILEALEKYPEPEQTKPVTEFTRAERFDPVARFLKHFFLPFISLAVLGGFLALVRLNDDVGRWVNSVLGDGVDRRSQIFSVFLYLSLSWGTFTILMYEAVGLTFDDLEWRDESDVGPRKSNGKAILLSILLGLFGADRFYLGYKRMGILKLITLGLFGVWWILDVVFLLMKQIPDAAGRPLVSGSEDVS